MRPGALAAVVVTHNRLAQLRLTLARLLDEAPGVLGRIVVVDNASGDDTALWLDGQTDPRLDILRLPENRGGAGGFEAGLARALEAPATEWVVLLDDDARPLPGALAAFDPPPWAGAAAAAVFLPGGAVCEMNRPSRNPFWHLPEFLRTALGGGRRGFHLADAAFDPGAEPCPIDIASFVGFFVSRAAVDRAGLPDGGLFLYGDDVLYSLRLRRAGVAMAFLPAVRFEHDCATFGPGFSYRPLWKIYYHCRNGVGIARAAAGRAMFPLALAWYLPLWWRRGRALPPPERRIYRRLLWLGVRHGLAGRRGRFDAAHEIAGGSSG